MKILLIGHSIIDHLENESESVKPGGVYYSTLGFLSNFKKDDQLTVLTSCNEKYNYLFENIYENVNKNYFDYVKEMPEVYLFTSGNGERRETYKNISGNLKIGNNIDLDFFDGIYINMITGFDISLDQLKSIRSKTKKTIYFDVHTLSRGIDKEMKRDFRPIPQINEWLECVDILQCNKNELMTIAPNVSEEDGARFVLENGVKLILITKAELGSSAYFKDDNEIKKITVNAKKIISKNKIGCGDIFGASFFYSYLKNIDLNNSLELADKYGAEAACNSDLTSITKLNVL